MPVKAIIAPSILASDFSVLKSECDDILRADNGGAEWLHFDIMDGHFVPNIALGPGVVSSMRKAMPEDCFFDVHMMVTHPGQWITEFAKAGANQVTFHIEATDEPEALVKMAKDANVRVGVAVKPKTPVESVFDLCDKGLLDMVLIMTVEPGFGGQSFMEDQMPKVKQLRSKYSELDIQVDGGLGLNTIEAAAAAGANVIVAGTSVFKAASRKDAINGLRDCVNKHIKAATAQM